MISRFGDYRCNPSDLTLPQTLTFMGTICGALFAIIFSARLTHHKMMVASLVISTVGICTTLLAPILSVACVGLFLNLFGATLYCEMFMSYMSEIVS